MFDGNESIKARGTVLAIFVGIMWVVRGIDSFLPSGFSSAGAGIVPRTWDGLYGIFITPFIHGDFEHLVSNTIPLLILGALILMRGVIEFVFVFLTTTIVSGAGTWLFGAGNAQHIGASGVVFGFFGYLVFRTAFDRKISSAIITLAVAILYGSAMAYSLIPEGHVSWSGHFFGFVGGFTAARLRYPATTTSVTSSLRSPLVNWRSSSMIRAWSSRDPRSDT
ncbi:MAG TPA: rhomboid family intramembrane serine protease [Thermoanaerobaculia bacterium]|nr:rhomboid family intramembrane serine protease [Thermoanaerobaculia bacterium]